MTGDPLTGPVEPVNPALTDSRKQGRLSPWRAHLLVRATRMDIAHCTAIIAMAAVALWAGDRAAGQLSPAGAAAASGLLDKLELPGSVPDAPLARDDGERTTVWSQATAPRTIVSFYAPWCAPCQEELPVLVRGTADKPQQLLVVVGSDEDPKEVRDKLDNLGLSDQRFHIDHSGRLQSEARVMALPTTLLIGRKGRVHERIVGYSAFRLQMLLHRATSAPGDDIDEQG